MVAGCVGTGYSDYGAPPPPPAPVPEMGSPQARGRAPVVYGSPAIVYGAPAPVYGDPRYGDPRYGDPRFEAQRRREEAARQEVYARAEQERLREERRRQAAAPPAGTFSPYGYPPPAAGTFQRPPQEPWRDGTPPVDRRERDVAPCADRPGADRPGWSGREQARSRRTGSGTARPGPDRPAGRRIGAAQARGKLRRGKAGGVVGKPNSQSVIIEAQQASGAARCGSSSPARSTRTISRATG
ncbi:hypothetical protein A6302_01104 [Methylobrevis pamukkalensis]|uniref:Uncharacterized protein n=2 Tax=Methylobrevis pamukkalensis TaxID=1439726 RepID=A0A1E3H7W8_9HYPH|nr:hypothetical protein A6302_01104 [Methylobrevis pamukkalensis]